MDKNGDFPAVTSDYLPTILSYLGLEYPDPERRLDGISLQAAIEEQETERLLPIGFQYPGGRVSWVGHDFKLIRDKDGQAFELYHLLEDPGETKDVIGQYPMVARGMQNELEHWIKSCEASERGEDYGRD